MHVSGSEEKFKQFIALVLKLLMKNYRQSVRSAVGYFAVNPRPAALWTELVI